MKKIITKSDKETRELGQEFARSIKGGVVLGLTGELGAGKTQFVKGLAKGFGIKESITSPTFVVLKKYKIETKGLSQPEAGPRLPCLSTGGQAPLAENKGIKGKTQKIQNLIHIDCYRLNSEQELLDLGLEEDIKEGNNVIVIEWAKRVRSILPKDMVWVEFKARNENERVITLKHESMKALKH